MADKIRGTKTKSFANEHKNDFAPLTPPQHTDHSSMHCVNDKPYRLPPLIVELVLVLVLINYLFLLKLCGISIIVTFT